jgi:hypothetical protein
MSYFRQFEDMEKIASLEEEQQALEDENRKLKKKLEKRNYRIQELEERVEELTRALGQNQVDSCSDSGCAVTTDTEQKPFENQPRRHQVDRFRDEYVKLDPLTQLRVLHFLGETKHYRLNQLGESVFEGSQEDFETALPVLQLLAPSMKHKNWCYLEHEHGDMTTCAGLRAPNQWSVEFTSNEIVFPEIKKHPIMGWEMDMTPGSYSHPLGANFAI